MSGGFFDVDTSVLRSIASGLEAAGGETTSAGEGLSATPDAGQSTHEVAAAIRSLSAAVAGLGEVVKGSGTELVSTAADYDASDMSAQETLSPGGTSGPGGPR